MIVIEYECKKCKHTFTRIFKDEQDKKLLIDECVQCGNRELKEIQTIDLPEGELDCGTCPKRSSGCGK
jgi:DNA-directed RNA polymerase subunit RPC12/RpoP